MAEKAKGKKEISKKTEETKETETKVSGKKTGRN